MTAASKVHNFYYFSEKKDQIDVTHAIEYRQVHLTLSVILNALDFYFKWNILQVHFKLNWLWIGIFLTTFWAAKNKLTQK